MALTLAQLIPEMQALFMDDGTEFNTAVCTAAIRQALSDWNQTAPQHQNQVIACTQMQYEYPLTDPTILNVTDVVRKGLDPFQQNNYKLLYNAYWAAGLPYVRLQIPEAFGNFVVYYTTPHTVSGLDSAVTSTLPAAADPTLLDGACFRACYARASGRIEQINLNSGVMQMWMGMAAQYRAAFIQGMAVFERQNPQQTPFITGWNDQFHNPLDDLLPRTPIITYPRSI
ncbi:MAG: hypothetical protein WCE68_05170 [Anaerolineales bacterium]